MKLEFTVKNIKCGGCANTIVSKLKALGDVEDVIVNTEDGTVTVQGDEARRHEYAQSLARMGYPETGSVQGIQSAGAKARSFISCAIGKINA